MNDSQTGIYKVSLKIWIDSSRDQVWDCFTQEINNWWPKEFYALEEHLETKFEPQVGGRLYETGANESSLLWFTVSVIIPKMSINLTGQVAPPFGGPAISMLQLNFIETDEGKTIFEVIDTLIGAKPHDGLEDDWRKLFETGLKKYIENK